MYFKNTSKLVLSITLLSSLSNICCKKFIDIPAPTSSISNKNVYSNDATSIAVLSGIYSQMSQNSIQYGGIDFTSIGFITGLTSDELSLYIGNMNTVLINYYHNSISAQLQSSSFWNTIYNRIYTANSAIQGLSESNGSTEKVRIQLLGEAKFIRALCYFYLVNLYGDVPLVLSPDYNINLSLSRTSQTLVWSQIIHDLTDATKLLSDNFLDATLLSTTNERVRPTKWAAISLLARSYLYTKEWKNAELESSKLIDQSTIFSLVQLNEKFKKNNKEAIWQLQPVTRGWNTEDAKAYIIPSSFGPNGASGVYLSNQLINAFELNDQRKKEWIDSTAFDGRNYAFAFKYQLNTFGEGVNEYNTVFRLSEQYLIRAEARAQQNNISGAREDLGKIREKAGLLNTSATTQGTLMAAIMHERQVELFTEYGHRWLDLKRTNNIDNVMSNVTPQKGGKWSTNWQWFPVPFSETQTDTNIKQNIGY